MEAALKFNQAPLEALTKNSDVMVWSANGDGENTRFYGWQQFSGQVEDEAAGEGWVKALHPHDRPNVISLWDESRRTGKPFFSEYRIRSVSGEYRWFRVSGTAIFDSAGMISEWIGTAKDVHQEHEAIQRLRLSEERYRLAVKASDNLIWERNVETGEVIWGDAIHSVFGYGDNEIGNSLEWWRSRIHPDDVEGVIRGVHDFELSSEQSQHFIYRFKRSDSTYAEVCDRTYAMRRSDGSPFRFVGAIQDFTDAERAYRLIEESEARYRFLAENASDMITRASLEGVREYVSPGCLEVTGYAPHELVGLPVLSIVEPEDAPVLSAVFSELARGGIDRTSSLVRLRRKDARSIWVESRHSLVRTDNGNAPQIVSVVRDVTERQELERQLRTSQRMEALGALSGGIAHDFNNLLTVIIGNAELLCENNLKSDLRELANGIRDAADRGAALTERLLSFARQQSLRPERIALDEVVLASKELFARTVGEHINVRTLLGSGGAGALTDRALLDSSILNLVVNARDAMPRGGRLTIATGSRGADENDGDIPVGHPVVYLQVTDTGMGMTQEVIERACEPFFTTKDAGKGSGLGLSMVYGLAKQSGGHVRIESTPGKGTSVTLVFRSCQLPPASSERTPLAETASTAAKGLLLLVEDEPAVRSLIRSQLCQLGYDVVDASDAESAMNLFCEVPGIDLLVSDVVLPNGSSGVELAHELRRRYGEIPVVLMSGYSEESFVHHGRPSPDMSLLRKPFRKTELASTVSAALDRTRRHNSSAGDWINDLA